MKIGSAAFALVLSACSLGSIAPTTGEPLIDQVVQMEGANSPCVAFAPSHHIALPDADGPPAMMTPDRFEDPLARRAAYAIAIDWKTLPEAEMETRGIVIGGWCSMSVIGPAISHNYAFLSYANPGGSLGAYAFRKVGDKWEVVEKVRLGFW